MRPLKETSDRAPNNFKEVVQHNVYTTVGCAHRLIRASKQDLGFGLIIGS
jgi:hypothetical protein